MSLRLADRFALRNWHSELLWLRVFNNMTTIIKEVTRLPMEDLVHECSPTLTIMPDGTWIQVIHSSLKDYLLEPDALFNPAGFFFRENDIHNHLVSILITYISFDCFNAELIQQTQPRNYFMEYASRWLVYHSIRAIYSACIEKQLINFFETAQGWKWLQRLSEQYGILLVIFKSGKQKWGNGLNLQAWQGKHC